MRRATTQSGARKIDQNDEKSIEEVLGLMSPGGSPTTTPAAGPKVCAQLTPDADKFGTYYKGKLIDWDTSSLPYDATMTPAACRRRCEASEACVYWLVHATKGCATLSSRKDPPAPGGEQYKEHGMCTRSALTTPTPAKATTAEATTAAATTTESAAATTTESATAPPVGAFPKACTKLDSVVMGVTGMYRGAKISTNGNIMTLAGCASTCDADAKCVYFAVHDRVGCILMSTKGAFVKSGAYDAGMGECTKVAATTTTTTVPPAGAFPKPCTKLDSAVGGVA